MKPLVALVLVFCIGCSSCFAGSSPDQKHIEKIKKQVSKYLERGAMVSVETYDQRKLRGEINEAKPDTFVLTVAGQPATLSYSDVKKIKAPMSPTTRQRIAIASVLGGLTGLLLVFAAQDK